MQRFGTFGHSKSSETYFTWYTLTNFEVAFITHEQFREGLKSWLPPKLKLDDVGITKMLLRLDEYGIGSVSISTLDEFAGTGSFIGKMASYSPHFWLPLIVWVDDNPDNNTAYVKWALEAGIKIFQFKSTAEAKEWIDENLGTSSCRYVSYSRLLDDQ